MYTYLKILILFIAMAVYGNALGLTEKYPSYTYVFNEFDIDRDYIYNVDFENFVIKNEKGLKTFYKRSLERGKDVLPTMQGLLVGEGVSDLFIYLSMVESGLSSTAISPKKAVGLWQFMPKTAKRYNLVVCSTYDERCDTASATSAAINYLNKLYDQFGKWYLAAMAYNCGEGCMERAIKKAGTDDLITLIDNEAKYLPLETREYIKKILLVAMIGENMTLGLDYQGNDTLENGLIEVKISSKTRLKEVAKLLKMKVETLKKLNAQIKENAPIAENKKFTIMIPIEKVFAFYLRYELESDVKTCKPHLMSHYVSLGETLASIALKYQTDSEEISIANHLENENLTLDQLLVIPVTKKVFEQTLLERE